MATLFGVLVVESPILFGKILGIQMKANEGVRILLALYSRLKPPPSEAERIELLEFFRPKEEEDGQEEGRDSVKPKDSRTP